ncbi:MAG: TlpA disulfide reductase family protein [Usitatibacteraceae bacterium]
MNRSLRLYARWALLVGVVAVTISACERGQNREDAVIGGEFPLVQLQGVDRADTQSATFRGKVLLVNVWATWCPPCRKEMPGLEHLHAQLDPARAAVIGLSVEDDSHQVSEWLRQSQITFPNYLDTGTPRAREALRIASYPQTFLVGPDGRVIERFVGPRDWRDPKWIERIQGGVAALTVAER